MKQTAVEWLVEQMIERNFFSKDTPLSYTTLEHLTNQAKQMEKEQILDAWKNGDNEFDEVANTFSEKYYNETFKSE